MTMDAKLLAKDLWELNGEVLDGDGLVKGPTDAMNDYAKGLITMLSAGIVSHLPLTVSGSAAPGAPLLAGAASAGRVIGLLGLTMTAIAAKDPIIAATMLLEANAISLYIMASGLVNFQSGSIEGTSTETASPGPLTLGKGTQGRFSGLDGGALAAMVASATGIVGPTSKDHYSVVVSHIVDNAEVTYVPNTVLGSMAGGTLVAGTAAGGTIK